jgi:biopolymer transport protein ExbD
VKFKRRSKNDHLELNLTPLIDCLLFLIIFFMLTTTFTKATRLQIKLPQAKADAPAAAAMKTVEVEISAGGDYAVNGQQLLNKQPLSLRSAIDKVAEGHRDISFIIAADGQTPHQSVVTVMDVAGQMGFENLSISTRLGADDAK